MTSLHGYRYVKTLGSGGFGEATVRERLSDRKLLVVKKMKTWNADMKKAADTEHEMLCRLRHRHIVGYEKCYVAQGAMWLVVEYCEGGDLNKEISSCIKAGSRFKEGQVVEWLSQICLGLQYLHKNNIIHRDLKPANLFLTSTRQIKIGDFGLARVLTRNEQAKTMCGTEMYMSPEQVLGLSYDGKVDVWSVGCCVYELLGLCHAVDATMIEQLMRRRPLPIRPLPNVYSAELRRLTFKMLTVEPAERPSVVDLLQESKLRITQTVKEDEEYERMKSLLSDKEHQLAQFKSQLSAKNKEIERLTAKVVSQEDEVIQQKSECLKLEAELSAVRSEMGGLKNSFNSSPPNYNKSDDITELKSELAKKLKLIAHQKAENLSLSNLITEMKQRLAVNDEEFEKLESSHAAEMAQMREQLSAKDSEIAAKKLENDRMVKETNKLKILLKDRLDRRTPQLKSSYEADAVKRNASDTIKVQVVPSKGDITALALLDNRLFAAHKVTGQRIDVYDASNLASKQRVILLERLGDVVYGLAASAANNCLYISDFYRRKIHQVQLSIVDGDENDVVVETSTRWNVDGIPIGLSLTSDLRLIVSCQSDIRTRQPDCSTNALLEFSADGQRLRTVRLHDSICTLHHAIQLTSGHFVVSHGVENDHERRVCVVDVDGHIVCKSSSGQLPNPRQLAVLDSDQVYVADCGANRIDVLSSSLEVISSISEDVAGNSFNRPFALCLDKKLNTLFVTGSAALAASDVKTREV